MDCALEQPVWGVSAIAAVINRTPAATRHLIREKVLPVTKIKGRYCALPSKLIEAVTANG